MSSDNPAKDQRQLLITRTMQHPSCSGKHQDFNYEPDYARHSNGCLPGMAGIAWHPEQSPYYSSSDRDHQSEHITHETRSAYLAPVAEAVQADHFQDKPQCKVERVIAHLELLVRVIKHQCSRSHARRTCRLGSQSWIHYLSFRNRSLVSPNCVAAANTHRSP